MWGDHLWLWSLLDDTCISTNVTPGDKQYPRARPRPDSSKSSSTSGEMSRTWWGRLRDCTCQCRWRASQTVLSEASAVELAWQSALEAVGHVCLYTRVCCPTCHAATCPRHHLLYTSAYNTCEILRRPENEMHLKKCTVLWKICKSSNDSFLSPGFLICLIYLKCFSLFSQVSHRKSSRAMSWQYFTQPFSIPLRNHATNRNCRQEKCNITAWWI